MKFMVFIRVDGSVELGEEQRAGIPAGVGSWVAEMDGRGVRLHGDVLGPVSDGRLVRVRHGEALISHAEPTADDITGYNILECADLDEALEVASKHPVATFGTLEVRPFADQ